MGRHDRPATDATELVEDRPAQGRAVGRVGAGPQLVQQHQRFPGRLAQDLADPPHVGRERRKRLFQALLIADIGEHVVEDRELRALARGDVQAGLGHQGEQADRFQGHGFAAGVGPGHDQDSKPDAETQVDRHHCFARRAGSVEGDARSASEACGR